MDFTFYLLVDLSILERLLLFRRDNHKTDLLLRHLQ
jgi:hypothetical protein